jgi:hypothetical protein
MKLSHLTAWITFVYRTIASVSIRLEHLERPDERFVHIFTINSNNHRNRSIGG